MLHNCKENQLYLWVGALCTETVDVCVKVNNLRDIKLLLNCDDITAPVTRYMLHVITAPVTRYMLHVITAPITRYMLLVITVPITRYMLYVITAPVTRYMLLQHL